MGKGIDRLIVFAAITGVVLFLSSALAAEPNFTEPDQPVQEAVEVLAAVNKGEAEPIATEQPVVSKENFQIQLAKEQLRGDFYKDSQVCLKWALGIIAALIGVFVIYTIFTDRKEYKEACTNAEKARDKAEQSCEKARDYEVKVQERLASINQLVDGKLREIEIKAKEKLDAIEADAKARQKEIAQQGDEERRKSLEAARRQLKISELFNKGYKAGVAEDYKTSADCYKQIVEDHKETRSVDVYNNWGNAISKLASRREGEESEELFRQAFEKYDKATKMKPDCHKAYSNWGYSFLILAGRKEGKDAEELFRRAEEKCLKAESIKTGGGAYNLGCIYAIRGDEKKCKEWLKVGEGAGTLETRSHAMKDKDLKSFWDKEWFKNLRWRSE